MVISEIVLANGSALILIVLLSSGLFFLGRGKNSKTTSSTQATSEQQAVEPEVDDSKIAQLKERAKSGTPKRLIPKDQLERGKKELRTLIVEKELVSAALTRLYEAEASGEITKEEREILGSRYRDELKALHSKITGLDVFVEVGDLETLRDQLLRLVGEKIEAIEKRIERTQLEAQPLIKEILERNSPKQKSSPVIETKTENMEKLQIPDISDMLVTPSDSLARKTQDQSSVIVESITQPQNSEITQPVSTVSTNTLERLPTVAKKRTPSSDSQVEELQKELLEALDRLEKLDVEA